jgi:hypothetical protein
MKADFVKSEGCQMSYDACKETFENPQQPMHELCDALDASIVDCLEQHTSLTPEEINIVLYTIYDEFNHDPDIVE